MVIHSVNEYEQAAAAAAKLEHEPKASRDDAGLAEIREALEAWQSACDNLPGHTPGKARHRANYGQDNNPDPGTNISPDDMPGSGLPGNIVKLRKN